MLPQKSPKQFLDSLKSLLISMAGTKPLTTGSQSNPRNPKQSLGFRSLRDILNPAISVTQLFYLMNPFW